MKTKTQEKYSDGGYLFGKAFRNLNKKVLNDALQEQAEELSKDTEQKIQAQKEKYTNEIITLKRKKETWRNKYFEAMIQLKEFRKNNEPYLIERNKRQEQIIIELQGDIQLIKEQAEELSKDEVKNEM